MRVRAYLQAIKESFQVVKQAKAAKKAGKGATSALAQASSIERSSDNKKKL